MKRMASILVLMLLGMHEAWCGHPVSKDFLLGKTRYEKDSCFVVIPKTHTVLSPEYGRIQKETYEAFLKMYDAARKDGITLTVTSASRNFWVQRVIWENKWKSSQVAAGKGRAQNILKYNSMPGISRHHWGTDLDFCSPQLSFWNSERGRKTYAWLKEHASEYGFFQPYTNKIDGRTGFNEEKWHWSYAPLSDIYTKAYEEMISSDDLSDFSGSQYAGELEVIELYVLGIAEH